METAGFRTKVFAKVSQKSFKITAKTRSDAEHRSGSSSWSLQQKHNGRVNPPIMFLVETAGFEPATPCMSSKYSNHLSYASVPLPWYSTTNLGKSQGFGSIFILRQRNFCKYKIPPGWVPNPFPLGRTLSQRPRPQRYHHSSRRQRREYTSTFYRQAPPEQARRQEARSGSCRQPQS